MAALFSKISAEQLFKTVTDSNLLKTDFDYLQKYGEKVKLGEKQQMRFGNHQTVVKHDSVAGEFEKIVEMAIEGSYLWDYKQQEKHIKDITSYIKGEKTFKQSGFQEDANINCQTLNKRGTDNPDAQFAFAPVFTGQLNTNEPIPSFTGNCFEQIDM